MRQNGPNGRRSRGRHHGGGHGGHSHGGGGHERHGGGGGGQGGNGNISNTMSMNRPRSAAALRHQTFDSHCLDVRVRGNAWQVCEKYQQLARDATSGGDRVAAENYLQHAEHYFRIIEAIDEATATEQRQRGGAPVPFGQQPDVPANYFAPTGGLAQPPVTPPPGGAPNPMAPVAPGAQQQQAQAEVIQQNPPQKQDPFFGNEEGDDQNGGTEPLVARR